MILEQNMNTDRFFHCKQSEAEGRIDRFYDKAAFGAVHFDGIGRNQTVAACLSVLDEAQSLCMDENMQTEDVKGACDYLSARDAKVRAVAGRFWDGLIIEDQAVRFEATAQALRVIHQQFTVSSITGQGRQ